MRPAAEERVSAATPAKDRAGDVFAPHVLRRPAAPTPVARITLRGLIVEHVWPEPRLFPWIDVERVPTSDEPPLLVEQDGSRPRPPGRRTVPVRLATRHECWIARRARARAFRRAWDDGTFSLVWTNRYARWTGPVSRCFGVLFLGGMTVGAAMAVRFFAQWFTWAPSMPAGSAAWITACLVFLLLLLVWGRGLAWWALRDEILRPRGNVERLVVTRDGLAVTLTDGTEVIAAWHEVLRYTPGPPRFRLSLLSGPELHIVFDLRLRMAFSLAVEAMHPETSAAFERWCRRTRRRHAAALSVIASVGLALLILGPAGVTGPQGPLGAFVLMPVVAVLCLACVMLLSRLARRLSRDWSRVLRPRRRREPASGRLRTP